MISVCLATYNGQKYIAEQLRSVLSQLGPKDEVVLSDDGSTDDTLVIVRSFKDPRIVILKGPAAHSPILNFQRALQAAKGDYLFLCDQDDVWLPNKVEVCMRHLQKVTCVVSDCIVTDAQLNTLSPSFRQLIGARKGRFYNLFVHNSYSGSCMAFRRELLQKSLPFPSGVLMHDIWLGNVAAFFFSVDFLSEKLILFRRHSSTTSSAATSSKNSLFCKLKARFLTTWHLIGLYFNLLYV